MNWRNAFRIKMCTYIVHPHWFVFASKDFIELNTNLMTESEIRLEIRDSSVSWRTWNILPRLICNTYEHSTTLLSIRIFTKLALRSIAEGAQASNKLLWNSCVPICKRRIIATVSPQVDSMPAYNYQHADIYLVFWQKWFCFWNFSQHMLQLCTKNSNA